MLVTSIGRYPGMLFSIIMPGITKTDLAKNVKYPVEEPWVK